MNYEALIETADQFAEKVHAGQVDKSGVDYINHPRAVAALVEKPEEKIVALLHDTIEDTDTTMEELREIFGDEIAEAVLTLTHREGEDYFDYVARAAQSHLTRAVKMADLTHNMDTRRLNEVTEKDLRREEKYKKAYDMLERASGLALMQEMSAEAEKHGVSNLSLEEINEEIKRAREGSDHGRN